MVLHQVKYWHFTTRSKKFNRCGTSSTSGTVTSVTLARGTGISWQLILLHQMVQYNNQHSPNVAETFTEWVVRDDDDDDKTLSGSTNKYLKFVAASWYIRN